MQIMPSQIMNFCYQEFMAIDGLIIKIYLKQIIKLNSIYHPVTFHLPETFLSLKYEQSDSIMYFLVSTVRDRIATIVFSLQTNF